MAARDDAFKNVVTAASNSKPIALTQAPSGFHQIMQGLKSQNASLSHLISGLAILLLVGSAVARSSRRNPIDQVFKSACSRSSSADRRRGSRCADGFRRSGDGSR
jgi:hypothetical protein